MKFQTGDTIRIVTERYARVQELKAMGVPEYIAISSVLQLPPSAEFVTTTLGTSSGAEDGFLVTFINDSETTEPEFVDVPEAAQLLGTTEKKLRKQLRAGSFDAHKVGDHWWVRRSSLLNS